jgi:hypothetical protein
MVQTDPAVCRVSHSTKVGGAAGSTVWSESAAEFGGFGNAQALTVFAQNLEGSAL